MKNEVKGKEDESGAGGCANVTWPVCWCTWMVFHYGDVGCCSTMKDFTGQTLQSRCQMSVFF